MLENNEKINETEKSNENVLVSLSCPEISTNSSIKQNIISLNHSYGYDCKKMYNLVLIEENVLVFASGTLVHFFNVATKTMTTRRSVGGGGIGCVTKNPNPQYNYLTIAENGLNPNIYIYKYPEMEVICILKNGTTRQFSLIDYSTDGELFGSQGGDPDYMLTIWDWKRKEVKLRAKSFSNDVVNMMFSPFIPEQLTTCGSGHIKFWKMSETFTGLKLQGLIGRFGKTEICDIFGIFPMPDDKILSGCEWGNILVWDAGLIKVEVCRKNRRPCHTGAITQIFFNNEEVMTIGTDGFVRIWFWETVELADPPEDDRFVEIEPMHEFRIGIDNYNTELLKIVKLDANNIEDYQWYAQDGMGGIWLCDLNTELRPSPPKQLFRCHAGQIVAMYTSSVSHNVATLGKDGRLYIYDYLKRELIFYYQFISSGADLIWLPVSIDPTGSVLIVGFADGIIRVISLQLTDKTMDSLQLIQITKCHHMPITKLAINPKGTILVSGSEDMTVFIHQIDKVLPYVTLVPIGFIKVPAPVTCFNWNPKKFSTLIVGCKNGHVIEADVPEKPNNYTDVSYHLAHISLKYLKFKSVKSLIRRNLKIREMEIRKDTKRARKVKELKKLQMENQGIDINEEAFLADSDNEEELEKLYIPEVANSVLWIQYTNTESIWLSIGGYDAGYIYEYNFDSPEPLSCVLIPNADDVEIHSYIYLDNYLILGMGDGKIRINRVKDDWQDLSDYWLLGMHDNFFGIIPSIHYSFDNKFLFSVGSDGNLFAYDWNLPLEEIRAIIPANVTKLTTVVFDIDDPSYMSLEQEKQKQEDLRSHQFATSNKNKVLRIIAGFADEFQEIMKKNQILPDSQKLNSEDLELDNRITYDLQDKLDRQMDVVRRKKEFDFEKVKLAGKKLIEYYIAPLNEFPVEVIGINNNKSIYSFRIKKLDEDYFHLKDDLEEKIRENALKKKMMDILEISLRTMDTESSLQHLESFLVGLTPAMIEFKLESKMRRLLNKYRERKAKESARKREWEVVNAEKPNPNLDHPNDVKIIEEAVKTVGDYKLKNDSHFEASEDKRDTTIKKFTELIKIREEIYHIRNDYNTKVFALREKKRKLIEFIKKKTEKLNEIHLEIPPGKRSLPSITIVFNYDKEYPEQNYDLKKYLPSLAVVGNYYDSNSQYSSQNVEEKNLFDLQRDILGITSNDLMKKSNILNVVNAKKKMDSIILEKIAAEEETLSEWEQELKDMRLKNKLFEQEQIIHKIDNIVKEFDQEVEKVSEERYQVEVKSKFKELYLLTLNQELWILKDFEQLEDKMVEEVDNRIIDKKQLTMRIAQTNNDIDMYKKSVEDLNENIKVVENKFNSRCLDDKFAVFFKKIFKKKYREIIDKTDEDEDEISDSESDSSSDEGSEMEDNRGDSVTSIQVGLKYLNENECPKDCDRTLYEFTFQLRRERNQLEKLMRDKYHAIETFQLELGAMNAKFERTEHELSLNQVTLSEFRRKKQEMLNNIDTLVMLKLDQMQYFKNQDEFEDLENTFLFNHHNVTKLYSRVSQLAIETIEAKRKHRINLIHLAKMKTDIKHMEKQIADLKEATNQAMLKKFGRIINLDEVQETILRRFAFEMQIEMRTNVDDIKKQYNTKINDLKMLKTKKQEEFNRVIQEGTEKLNILTVLEEEKNYLYRIISYQSRKKDQLSTDSAQRHIGKDVCKLKEISKHQKDQIEMLQREIRALSLKSKSFVDARQEFESLNYNIKQLNNADCEPFEDSICSNIDESLLSSTRATTPDQEIYCGIFKIITSFLYENLNNHKSGELDKSAENLSKYLTNVAINFSPNHAEELMPHVVQNFKKYLPKNSGVEIAPKKIALLFEKIVKTFNTDSDINPRVVLREIIGTIIESSVAVISTQSYLQHVLIEMFKQMIITMRFEDITNDDCIEEIVQRLSQMTGIHTKNVNVSETVTSIMKFAAYNLEEDINADVIKKFITEILIRIDLS